MFTGFHTRLAALPLIGNMHFSPAEMAAIEKIQLVREFKKNEFLLHAGEEEKEWRFVYKGLVRVFYTKENREINTAFAQEDGIVCSFSSYFSRQPSYHSIQALESSKLVCFKRDELDALMSQSPKFVQFGVSLVNFMISQKEQREMDLLNNDALGRLQHFLDTQPGLFLRLPQIYIASYLNIRPETLSALKRKLINKRVKD